MLAAKLSDRHRDATSNSRPDLSANGPTSNDKVATSAEQANFYYIYNSTRNLRI